MNVEQRIRTMRTLWIAMLLSVGMYYVFTLFVGRPESAGPNPNLTLILVGIGLVTTAISFPIKSRFLARAVDQQQPQLVQQGYILTWAVTEIAALLGLLDFYLTDHRHYFILFVISALGQLLHFPRREHVTDAAFHSTF
jgi:hypothetical protein